MAKKDTSAKPNGEAEKDDNIEIELIDGDDGATGDVEVVEVSTKTEVTPQDGVDELRKQLDSANSQKAAAQAAQRQAEARATTAVSEVDKSRIEQLAAYETTAKQVLDANKKALDAAKGAFKTAMEGADYVAAAEAQASIADAMQNIKGAQYQVSQLEGFKKQIESGAGKVERREAPVAQDAASDSGIDPTSRSGRWVNAHAEQWKNPVFQRKALLADAEARAAGVELDSDEYFRRIETAVGLIEEVKVEKKEVSAPKAGATAAAPTRQAGSDRPLTPQKVRLTAAEVEAAALSGLTPTQYAKQRLALEAEGKLTRRPN